MKDLLKNLNGSRFITKYTEIPINKYNQTMRGYDSRNNELKFTESDKAQIIAGLHRLIEDLQKKRLK